MNPKVKPNTLQFCMSYLPDLTTGLTTWFNYIACKVQPIFSMII